MISSFLAVSELLTNPFNSDFADRWSGGCSGWTKELVLYHFAADALIFIAYMIIPIILLKIKKKRQDVPFNIFMFLFAMFIIGCGFTHLMTMITSFYPVYHMDFWVKAVTAAASVGTAWVFYRSYHQIIAFPNPIRVNEELIESNEKLNETLKMLETVNKELDSFALVAAHDLQDPLKQNAVLIRYIKENNDLDLIDDVIENNIRMQNFIKKMLDFARSGGVNVSLEETRLSDVVWPVIVSLHDLMNEHKAIVHVNDPLPTVMCDKTQLGRVFYNLIKNAILNKDPNRLLEVEISVKERENDMLVSLKDNGSGIEPELIPKLFIVYRGKKRDSSGVGLGLAICKRIIEGHQGKIWVDSVVGEGSCFKFTLPK